MGVLSVWMWGCAGRTGGAPRPSHEAGQQEYSRHSSMLEFLRSKKTRARGPSVPASPAPQGQLPSCGMNQVCEPTGVRVDRLLLLEGPREVGIIQECQCEINLTQCLRVPALRTYYSETPYEAVLDVGGCSRSKGSPELVETPNKVELIQKVVSCELKESCYRVPYMEYHYEVVHNDGVKEERLKVEINLIQQFATCGLKNSPAHVFLRAMRPTASSTSMDRYALSSPSHPAFVKTDHSAPTGNHFKSLLRSFQQSIVDPTKNSDIRLRISSPK
ncbi:hypothetical protein F7725_011215, partial [Dissostichus mawsoni]